MAANPVAPSGSRAGLIAYAGCPRARPGRSSPRSSHHPPGVAVFAGEPLRVAGAAGELFGGGVPLQLLAVAVAHVEEVAGVDGVGADLDGADRVLARADGVKEVGLVVVADVEEGRGVAEQLPGDALGLGLGVGGLFLRLAVGGGLARGVGEDLVAQGELELAAVDVQLPLAADESDAVVRGV